MLIHRANERGGEDNITAVLIKIEEVDDTSDQTVRRDRRALGLSNGAAPEKTDKKT